ncbi:MAG TPA: alpha-amylase family glycosyl hydrolase [Kofleriaceae bacterium]|nr:alpha-amylase family glycosyl hydrolase [Kofleriaceae bacterium]
MRLVALSLCGVAACGSGGGAKPDAASGDAAVVPPDADLTAPPLTTWPADAIFYHAYVRSFLDSDGDGNGDLPGMQQKLDYIAQLGVDGILLLPIFDDAYVESGGYGTTDWTHVTAAYGGDAAFASFVAAAHAKNLKVLLDLSFTLVADQHPWFVAADASAAAPERAHFLVTAGPPCPTLDAQAGGNGWHPFRDSQCFFSDYAAQFPSTNVRDQPTAEAMRAVADQWLAAGVDGFRLDSAASIAQVDPQNPTAAKDPSSPATHAFWLPFMQRVKRDDPQAFAVAELFDHEADYYADGIDMTFQYQIYFGLVDGWTKGIKSTLSETVAAQVAARPPGAMGGVFLGNHDVPGTIVAPGGRLADLACPLPCTDHTPLVSAAQLLFSLPGTPFVYYGEELGMHGAPSVDTSQPLPWSRNPMQWDATATRGFTTGTPWAPVSTDSANAAAQVGVDGSMYETYRGLIAVRRTSPALTHGTYREVPNDRADVFSFVREDPAERVLVVASFAHAATAANLDLASLGITSAIASERIFGGALPAVTPANASAYPVPLPASGAIWILLQGT